MRLDRLFLKMFQVEPRIPVRLLLDVSSSMAAGSSATSPTKFTFAQKLAACLCYVGLVRLDTITIQPFAASLLDPFLCGGGRHRFQPAEEFLRRLQPQDKTDYLHVVRQFIGEYPQRGLVILISDFLDDQDCFRPLQYLADFGHELLFVQVWGDEDREPSGEGEMELVDSETGAMLRIGLNEESRLQYISAFDDYCGNVRKLAQHNGGRYTGLPASTTLEEAVFGSLVRTQGVL